MALTNETFESYALGASIDGVYPSGQTLTAESAAARTGTRGAQRVLSSTAAYIRRDIAGATGRQLARVEFEYPGPPPATATLFEGRNRGGSDVRTVGVQILSTGVPQVFRANSGTAVTESRPGASPFVPGVWYAIEQFHVYSGSGTNAHFGYRVIDVTDEDVLHEWTTTTGGPLDVGTAEPTNAWRFGGVTSSQWAAGTLHLDNLRYGPQESGWAGPIAVPPTPIADEWDALVVDMRGSLPGGANPLTYTIAHVSGPDNSGDIVEPVDGLFLIPRDASTSVYEVTVDEGGGGIDTHEVTVYPGGGFTGGIIEEIRVSGAWV